MTGHGQIRRDFLGMLASAFDPTLDRIFIHPHRSACGADTAPFGDHRKGRQDLLPGGAQPIEKRPFGLRKRLATSPAEILGGPIRTVIGVPLPSSEMNGIDSLHAIVQMPPGIPVGCVAIGGWGARNAGHMAAEIIGLWDDRVAQAIDTYRESLRG